MLLAFVGAYFVESNIGRSHLQIYLVNEQRTIFLRLLKSILVRRSISKVTKASMQTGMINPTCRENSRKKQAWRSLYSDSNK